jgi:hypothetical protein
MPTAKQKQNKNKNNKKPAAKEKGGEKKKSMAESFTPLTTPLNWTLSLDEIKKANEFLDPCGMEATDDIIDGIVGEQLDKCLPLLCKALEYDASIAHWEVRTSLFYLELLAAALMHQL